MTALNLARFRKVCGLLSSNHDGERATAASMATAMLRAAGMSWADIGVGAWSPALVAQAYSDAALVDILKMSLDGERARTTRQCEEIARLKREVARLKGMWTKEPA